MHDPLWGTTWKISAGALGLAAAAAAVLLFLGHSHHALGLMCGAFLSGLNFLATGQVLDRARKEAKASAERTADDGPDSEEERRQRIAASNQAAFRFVLRYVIIGAVLALLILGFGLPPATTILGVAAVPLTIYVWQMGRLLTGGWKRSVT